MVSPFLVLSILFAVGFAWPWDGYFESVEATSTSPNDLLERTPVQKADIQLVMPNYIDNRGEVENTVPDFSDPAPVHCGEPKLPNPSMPLIPVKVPLPAMSAPPSVHTEAIQRGGRVPPFTSIQLVNSQPI